MDQIIGISPLQFVHVLDLNTNITRVEVGPQTVVLESNERLIGGPFTMIVIPPAHYCVIKNPMSKYVPGKLLELNLGQFAVKFHCEPFCLYPGEVLVDAEKFGSGTGSAICNEFKKAIKPQPVIKANSALRLKALLDFTDDDGSKRYAGFMWQLEGPLLYYPTPNAEIVSHIQPVLIVEGTSLRLAATQDFIDKTGQKRVTGEEWFVKTPGAYLPGVCEKVVSVEKKTTLTVDSGLILSAQETLVDSTGKKRLAGEQWLLTGEQRDEYYPEIGVEIVKQVKKTVLTQGQYCVVVDPVNKDCKPQLGKRELRRGCCSFFLHPGEKLESGIQNNYILAEDEGLLLQSTEEFIETISSDQSSLSQTKQQTVVKKTTGKKKRKCGERWMILGPYEYVPPTEVRVLAKRKQIPLSKNEGIYVQDLQSGKVRAEMGPQSYMLKAYEELWEKELTPIIENLLRLCYNPRKDTITLSP